MCNFSEAWIGKCRLDGEPYCDKHKDLICCSCGAKATQSCDATGGLCCGMPLCDDCEHTIGETGVNAGMWLTFNCTLFENIPVGMNLHCRKNEQKYIPWYERES